MKTISIIITLLSLQAGTRFAGAATLTVTNLNDSGPGSLRDTIAAAASGDSINFAPNLSGSTITLTSGELMQNQNLTIDASALANGITINGNHANRVFEVTSGTTMVMTALTIANGLDTNATALLGGAVGGGGGGGVRNGGTLTLNRCTLSGNSASFGGGIRNEGTLTVDRSTLSGNVATSSNGGGVNNAGTMFMNQCTVAANTATNLGGGIRNTSSGTAYLTNCTISANVTTNAGGGGINIGSGTVTVFGSIVAGNNAATSGEISGSISDAGFNLTTGDPMLALLGSYGGPTQTMPPLSGSAAIDNGSDAVTNIFVSEQRGFPRLSGLHVDIGAVESPFFPATPMIVTQPATGVAFAAATLNAIATPNGTVTSCYFQYGTTTNYGLNTAIINLSAGKTALSTTLAGLSPVTVYHFRAVATNGIGKSFGNDGNFRTGGTNLVTNLNDSGPGSLRNAIAASGPGDFVGFVAGLTGTITLTSGELVIGWDLSVLGPGQMNLTVSGNHASRVLNITSGVVNISGLTVANGTNYSATYPYGEGGGIYNHGTLTAINCAFFANSAARGGAVFNSFCQPNLPTLNNCTFVNNTASDFGGAIYSDSAIMLSDCTFATNSSPSGWGGAIGLSENCNYSSMIDRCSFTGNSCYNQGGGINLGSRGLVVLNNCTFSGNSADIGAGMFIDGFGADTSMVTLNNCTLSGNSAGAFEKLAGGIYVSRVTLTVNHCTVSGNSANTQAGGMFIESASGYEAAAIIQNTIIAGNNSPDGPDVSGTNTSLGHNFIGTTNGSSGWVASDLVGSIVALSNPLLGPLQDNGGPTFTMALLPGSPAIDAGNSGGTSTDQRGHPRPTDRPAIPNASGGDGSDIGAYEVGPILTRNIVGGGIVNRSSDPFEYALNSTVTLTAIAASGWVFSGWSDDASGTTNPLTVVMTSNKFITANFTPTASACALPSGLVSWWPGDGNADDIFASDNGTLTGTFTAGKVGQAFHLNGGSDGVALPDIADFQFASQFSIEAWIRQDPADLPADGVVRTIFGRFGLSRSYRLCLVRSSAVWYLQFHVSTDGFSFSGPPGSSSLILPAGWNHVAGTFNGGAMKIYLNGAEVYSGANYPTPLFTGDAVVPYIGRDATGNNGFHGEIDELSVYNRALSASEVSAIFNGKCATPTKKTLITLVSGVGTVLPSPVQSDYLPNTTVTLTALPGVGWFFNSWSGDASGTNNPLDVVMTTNKSITANFYQPTLTVSVNGGGVVVKNPDQLTYTLDSTVNLSAYPAAGWRFNAWSGNASGTDNPLNVGMTTNKSVTANFSATSASACVPVPAGVVSWWPGGSNANDIIGTNNGTLQGAVTYAPGKVGRAFNFNGTDAAVYIPGGPALTFASEGSVEAWIRPDDVDNYRQIFYQERNDLSGAYWALGLAPNGSFRLEINGGSGIPIYDVVNSPPGLLSVGTWTHVAATFNGGTMSLYLNGTNVAVKHLSISYIFALPPTAAYLGARVTSQRFAGLIDELSVYNRELNSQQFQLIYNRGSAGKCLMPLYITDVNKPGNNVNLLWLSQKGMPYRVEYKTNLTDATWLNVSGDVSATTNTASKTDSTLGNAPQRFYRVEMFR